MPPKHDPKKRGNTGSNEKSFGKTTFSKPLCIMCEKKSLFTNVKATKPLPERRKSKYRNYSKIIRVMGWVLRICFNLKARTLKGETRYGALTVVELLRAEMMYKEIQKREFSEEYAHLGNKDIFSKKSKLQQLSPYLVEEGLI